MDKKLDKKFSSKARILMSLAYSGQFDHPLTTAQVWQRIPGGRSYSGMSLREFSNELLDLSYGGVVVRNGDYWQLANKRDLSMTRNKRRQIALQKMQETDGMVKYLKMIPWVRGLAVTGSVAMDSARENDDVDFLVITQPSRLWLVRPLVIAAAWLSGKRRTWHREENNSWCFNMWLDTENLTMPLEKRSIYGAFEVVQARWLFSKDGVAEKFFRQNAWVEKFLPNAKVDENFEKIQTWDLPSPLGFVFDLLDWLVQGLQFWYMKPHRTVERVGSGYAFFHPRDTYAQIISGWREQLRERGV